MRIIKQGNIKLTMFYGRCRKCDTEIEITENEVKWSPDYSPREPSTPFYPCPTCRADMWVEKQSERMKR